MDLFPAEIWSIIVTFIRGNDDDVRSFARLRQVNTFMRDTVDNYIASQLSPSYLTLYGYYDYRSLRGWALTRYFTPHMSQNRKSWDYANTGRIIISLPISRSRLFILDCYLRCIYLRYSYLARKEYRNLLWWFPAYGQAIEFRIQPYKRLNECIEITMIELDRCPNGKSVCQRDVIHLFTELLRMIQHTAWSIMTPIDAASMSITTVYKLDGIPLLDSLSAGVRCSLTDYISLLEDFKVKDN